MSHHSQAIDMLWAKIRDPGARTMMETLGIEIQEITPEFIKGSMPVDHRTIQYYGMLHGGASVAFAESLASLAALVHVDPAKDKVVGQEINANHIRGRAEGSGKIFGVARPLHLGKRSQVWEIRICDSDDKLVCISRCTIAVVPRA